MRLRLHTPRQVGRPGKADQVPGYPIPANARADKAVCVPEFLIEGFGGFSISMSAWEHGNAGERAARLTDRIALAAEAEDVFLPLRVLLGALAEFDLR